MKVFLTGGTGDIGSAIKECFKKNGYDVIAPSRAELNLEESDSIERYFQNNSNEFNIFVHCAGYNNPMLIKDMEFSNIEKTAKINYLSFIQIMKYILPDMVKNKYGKVLAISSLYGSFARQGRLAYVTSKHALQGAVKTYACEYGKDNILFNSLSPGFVMTKMTRKNNSDEVIKKLTATIPLERMAETAEIAETVLYLCSDKNSYITGQNIIIDGGCTAEGGMHSL